MIRAGTLRKLVTIQTITRADDGAGGFTETWTDTATVRAAVAPLEGREQLEAMQTGLRQPVRVRMRYRAGVTTAQRLVYEGRTLEIQSVVDPEERHRELVLLATETTVR